jgi:type III secretion protein C
MISQRAPPTVRENSRERTDAARGRAVDALVNALGAAGQPVEDQQQQAMPAYDPSQVSIEAEPRLNAIIVRDARERLARYEQLITALDVEPQSLEIEATIIDVNTDRMRELGVDWLSNSASAGFAGSVPTVGSGGFASVVLGSAKSVHSAFARSRSTARRAWSPARRWHASNVEALFDNS